MKITWDRGLKSSPVNLVCSFSHSCAIRKKAKGRGVWGHDPPVKFWNIGALRRVLAASRLQFSIFNYLVFIFQISNIWFLIFIFHNFNFQFSNFKVDNFQISKQFPVFKFQKQLFPVFKFTPSGALWTSFAGAGPLLYDVIPARQPKVGQFFSNNYSTKETNTPH